MPSDPRLLHMWKAFWGQDLARLESSNRKNVVPGSWRVEVSPSQPAEEDLFLHVLEIGNTGVTGKKPVKLVDGFGMTGAAFDGGPAVLFSSSGQDIRQAEVSFPALHCDSLLLTGLSAESMYELSFSGLNVSDSPDATLPGVLKDVFMFVPMRRASCELKISTLRISVSGSRKFETVAGRKNMKRIVLLGILSLFGAAAAAAADEVPRLEDFQVLPQTSTLAPAITPYLNYQVNIAWEQDDVRRKRFEQIRDENELFGYSGNCARSSWPCSGACRQ